MVPVHYSVADLVVPVAPFALSNPTLFPCSDCKLVLELKNNRHNI